jgi:WD40 repeat protein
MRRTFWLHAALFVFFYAASGNLSIAADINLHVDLGHSGGILSVTFSPDGRMALTGSDDGTVGLWDAATGREIRHLDGHSGYPSPKSHPALHDKAI